MATRNLLFLYTQTNLHMRYPAAPAPRGTQVTCFTSTKVRILTRQKPGPGLPRAIALALLPRATTALAVTQVLILLAVLVQTYKY